MRPLVLFLALTISPAGLAVCQLTCSAQAVSGQTTAAMPSCHESGKTQSGPALKADNLCRHAGTELPLLAKASKAFQLAVISVQASTLVVLIPLRTKSFDPRIFPPTSPPPLLIPLRI
jgi:hypothetical protein